jgi:hypothetical protein
MVGDCNRTHISIRDYFLLFRITFCILPFHFGDLPRKSSAIRCVSTVFIAEDHRHLLQRTKLVTPLGTLTAISMIVEGG